MELATGKISTVAGNGAGAGGPYGGYSGDGGFATSAELNNPMGVAVDDSGNIYIADYYNNRIRKVSASTHHIQTVAGNGFGADTTGGFSGDSLLADSAELFKPTGVAVDDSGNIYIADSQNDRIRKVTVATGIINTIAGNGSGAPTSGGFSGDSGLATSGELYYPTGIALDAQRNIYFTDKYNNRVRRVDASTHIISTIAGDGTFGFAGDGGPADSAQLAQPVGIAVDDSGNVYVADVYNNRIREILNAMPCTPVVSLPSVYDSICTGANGKFTAILNNGGSKPIFQWKLNGNNVGTDSVSYSYSPVHNGDKISCIVTSNASCAFPKIATSDTLKMGIYSGQVKPTIAISASADSVCSNIPVTFSSSVLRGGVNPVYVWKLNGDSISDSSSVTLTNLHTGNSITCTLSSSLTCASPDTALSDTIVMTMDSAVVPTLTITAVANPVCIGLPAIFTASAVNGGTSGLYTWAVNSQSTGITDTSFTSTALVNGDTVNAFLLSSLVCLITDSAISNSILVVVNPLPSKPIITQSGDSLISNSTSGNQWYFDSSSIGGATGTVYVANQSGNYYTVVTDSNGCVSNNSDTINYVVQGIEQLRTGNFNLYPNPSNGLVDLTIKSDGFAALEIFDGLGQKIYAALLNQEELFQTVKINISSSPDGIYILKLTGAEKSITAQIIVQK